MVAGCKFPPVRVLLHKQIAMGRQNEAKLVILESVRRYPKARPLSLFRGPQSSWTLCGHILSLSVPKTFILRMHLAKCTLLEFS